MQECEVQSNDAQYYVMRVRPYRTVANVIDGVVITFENISRLKRAEHVRRLATVVQDSNDAITLQDSQGTFLAWNRGAEQMYGYTEAEALRMNIRDLVPESKREESLELAKRVFAGDRIDSFYTQRLTKNGQVLDVWLTITPLLGEDGHAVHLATTERDISERNRQETQLAETKEQFCLLFEIINDSYLLVDARTGAIAEFNQRAHEHLGYTRDEFQELAIPDIVGKECAKDVMGHLQNVIHRGSDVFETKHKTRHGEMHDVQVRAKVMSIRESEFILSTWRDITPADTTE
jgi:PAS domain S-box-containing protein